MSYRAQLAGAKFVSACGARPQSFVDMNGFKSQRIAGQKARSNLPETTTHYLSSNYMVNQARSTVHLCRTSLF